MNYYNQSQVIAYKYPIIDPREITSPMFYSTLGKDAEFKLRGALVINRCIDAMQGRPTWMVSATLRSRAGWLKPVNEWDKKTLKAAEEVILKGMIRGAGTASMERMFHLTTTLCYHRALSVSEIAGLRPLFLDKRPTSLTSGPTYTYYQHGIPKDLITLMPCMHPKRQYFDMTLTEYTVDDCGECRPCQARLAMTQFIELMNWPVPEEKLYRTIEAYNKRLSGIQQYIFVET
jgi:hypothetical protein